MSILRAVVRRQNRPPERRNMRVMVIVKANQDSEAGNPPTERVLTEMEKLNEDLAKAGVMLAVQGLHPSSKGKRVRLAGAHKTVIDGPFSDKELVAGFWLWHVRSMDEAVEWAKRIPHPENQQTDIEIRPVFEAEEFPQ
jgi:hypothetical protein